MRVVSSVLSCALVLASSSHGAFVPSNLMTNRDWRLVPLTTDRTHRHAQQSSLLSSSLSLSSSVWRLASSSSSETDPEISPFALHALQVSETVESLRGETVVVKYGGNAMTSPELASMFCQDVAALQRLGVRVVVVHGGGPQIKSMLERVGVESNFVGGMRVSNAEVVGVAEMVLSGSVNKSIVASICAAGGRALGISGRDDGLLQCTKLLSDDGSDIGFVGKVETVNCQLLQQLLDAGITPVVAPIGCGCGDEATIAYNVNADVAAGRIAGEMGAARVLFLTDIAGVLDKQKQLLRRLSIDQVKGLIADETITGGMIPKVSYATDALQLGVESAFITDGRVPHALLNQLLSEEGQGGGGGGTIVTW